MAPEPDYDWAESLDLTTEEQHRAIGNLTRHRMLGLLDDKGMTITQLARRLGVLKGSASYHVRLLERAGLVRVVRTRKVRGVVERYYGRTARRFEIDGAGQGPAAGAGLLRTVAAELAQRPSEVAETDLVTSVRARISTDRAAEFRSRLEQLLDQFRASSEADAPQHGLAVALYRTGLPTTVAANP
jgi:DNA-binding transcriptional ArsR family regulator